MSNTYYIQVVENQWGYNEASISSRASRTGNLFRVRTSIVRDDMGGRLTDDVTDDVAAALAAF